MSLDVYLFCPECGHTVGEHNVTHNLRNMADEAGIYKLLWIPPVTAALLGYLYGRLR